MAVGRRSRDDAARAVWEAHYAQLAGWCAALVGDVDEAHDLAAEAFSRLLGRWSTVREPKPFLYAVAANLAKDRWRRQATERRHVEQTRRLRETSTPAVEPWLRDLVERLPDRLRVPVLLHYYADLPVAEVAAVLRRPEGTVKRLLSEGRAALLDSMEER